jgi:hypothetical protein
MPAATSCSAFSSRLDSWSEAGALAGFRHRAGQAGNVQLALLQEIEDTMAEPVDGGTHVGLAGQDQHLGVRADLLDLFRELDAPHAGHDEVEHGHPEAPVGGHLEGGAGIGGWPGVKSLRDKQLGHQ